MNTRSFGILDAFKFGFRTLGKNFLLILGVVGSLGLILFAITLFIHSFIIPLEVSWARSLDIATDQFNWSYEFWVVPVRPIVITPVGIVLLVIASSFATLVGLCLKMFLVRIGLDTYEHGFSSFDRMKEALPRIGTFLLTELLFYLIISAGFILHLIISAGFILLLIPGLIWFFKYNFASFIVLDSDRGPVEAIKRSGEITYGHKWRLLAFYLVWFIASAISSILIVGPLVFYFVMLFARVYVYRKLDEASRIAAAEFTAVRPSL